ncbi:MAG: L-seryl-tRNA(Sec) selenium transferase [Verrucomicrobiales bacterium]|nr:L-seryl-tRNA(Sec) selenium transferase [Verrucomicrobiales bacterium]
MAKKTSLFSKIPAVDKVLHALGNDDQLPPLPLPLVTDLVRGKVESLRDYLNGGGTEIGEFDEIVSEIKAEIFSLYQSRIHPVINGTGVIIHTNLGRSPLSETVVEKLTKVGQYYNNIELDLGTGERGKRGGFLEVALANLIESEAATVCNNCAAALILILKHLANGEKNEVIISRGELVEIGGGFRVPDIMAVSGAKLVEVGATNKTTLADYENAITERTGMLLKVHRSNFYMEGFTHEPTTEELVELGRERDLPVVEDLGSGAMLPTDSLAPIPHEPTATEVLNRGVDIVCVSGDKLFGGPQAGIIAGRADLIAGLKKEPFFRALRCDKLILTGLQETVIEYLNRSSGKQADLPLVRMLSLTVDDLMPRAKKIVKALNNDCVSIGEGLARCGGGTMPKAEIPSVTIDIAPKGMGLKKFARLLRDRELPMVGYVAEDKYRLDLRTIMPEQDADVIENLKAVLTESR